jgi:acetylornithine deacetylase/succinyl-diaminopimelate desuccinylase-like protein
VVRLEDQSALLHTKAEGGQSPLQYARSSHSRFVRELQEFVRIPSVSSDPASKLHVNRCANWLASQLRKIGVNTAGVVETGGHPVVCGWIDVSPTRPTVLIYGHYDVQPVQPESAWRYPPFSGQISEGYLYGRGAADDKGQLFAHVKALEAWLRTKRSPPCNVRILFEGEEEIGSPNLSRFMEQNKWLGQANGAVVSDTQMRGPGQPALTVGLRGKLSFDLVVEGPAKDLHSGSFGGAIRNPLEVLCELIAGLHDAEGRIAVAGIYDDVLEAPKAVRRRRAQSAPRAFEIFKAAGVNHGWGEAGFSPYERVSIRPALSVNGITGGHQGPGSKSIVPSKALAKLSFRLVPNQDPGRVARLVSKHLETRCPPGVRCRVVVREGALPVRIDERAPIIRAATLALTRTFGKEPVLLLSGGSIPIVETLDSMFSMPTALMGFALPTDGLHGPNERFEIRRFGQAVEASIRLLSSFATLAAPSRSRLAG